MSRNRLIEKELEKREQERLIVEMMKEDEKDGLYVNPPLDKDQKKVKL